MNIIHKTGFTVTYPFSTLKNKQSYAEHWFYYRLPSPPPNVHKDFVHP